MDVHREDQGYSEGEQVQVIQAESTGQRGHKDASLLRPRWDDLNLRKSSYRRDKDGVVPIEAPAIMFRISVRC